MSPAKTGLYADDSAQSARAFVFTAILLAITLAVSAIAQLPRSLAVGWLASQRAVYTSLWPQQWQFFAKASDLVVTVPYRIDEHGAEPTNMPLMSADDLWGLGRDAQTQIIETYLLAGAIPAGDWVSCEGKRLDECVDAPGVPPLRTLPNTMPSPTLCGRFRLVVERPDGTKRGVVWQPIKAVTVELSCAHRVNG